jgi:hypothetical protein
MTRSNRSVVKALLPALAVLSLAACGADAGSPPAPASGIEGRAVVDTGCPVLTTQSACPTVPVTAHLRVTALGGGREVAAVDTGADGRFQVRLPAGRYQVDATASGIPMPMAPLQAEVAAGRFTEVRVVFDSGVRSLR